MVEPVRVDRSLLCSKKHEPVFDFELGVVNDSERREWRSVIGAVPIFEGRIVSVECPNMLLGFPLVHVDLSAVACDHLDDVIFSAVRRARLVHVDKLAADHRVIRIVQTAHFPSCLSDVSSLAPCNHRGAVVAARHEVGSVLGKTHVVYRARVPLELLCECPPLLRQGSLSLSPPTSCGLAGRLASMVIVVRAAVLI
jgi:hypothetical protein